MRDGTVAVEVDGVTRRFGEVTAVDEVSLTVRGGTRHAVIGPNGAGKSTLFSLVAGTLKPSSGRVGLFGRDVTGMSDHRRARLGMARTFQHSSVFGSMSVLDNVVLAAARKGGGIRPWGRHRGVVLDRARDAVAHVGLGDKQRQPARWLSHGERRQLEVAMALSLEPRLLLFDEPTAGMSEAETENFVRLITELPRDITVLLIEHDLEVVFALATEITVLHLGRVLEHGTPERVRASAAVQQTYLGEQPANASEVVR